MRITGPAELPGVTLNAPQSACSWSWKVIGATGKAPPVTYEVLNPAPGVLKISSPAGVVETPADPLKLLVQLLPDAQPEALAALRGFIVRFDCRGRHYHRAVALPAVNTDQRLELLLSPNAGKPTESLDEIRTRPAQGPQPYYLFVRNPTNAAREVIAQVCGPAAATAKLTVPAGQTQQVVFPPAAPAKPGASAPELHGPLDLTLADAATRQTLATRRVPVSIAAPREYVRCTQVLFEPGSPSKNRLIVTLAAQNLPPGPPCIARLVLPPDEIPGLLAFKGGMLVGELKADGTPLTLFASDMQLLEGFSEQGRFYVTIDGASRALAFDATFARYGDPTTPRERYQPALGVSAEAIQLAGPAFRAKGLVERAPYRAWLEMSLGREVGGRFEADVTRRLPSARRKRIGFSPAGANGAMTLQVDIADWDVTLDAAGLIGERLVRARLITSDGHEIRQATQRVVLDDTPPAEARFVNPPRLALAKAPLTLRVQGGDDLTGVTRVAMFVGRPQHGKPPAGVTLAPGKALDKTKTLWEAHVPAPSALGTLAVTAQLTNAVGLSRFVTTNIEVVSALPTAAGGIQGVVLEGPRPQANLEVVLYKAGGEQAKAKTNAHGVFVFQNVKPGEYVVSSAKTESQRKGAATVKVRNGQTSVVTVKLYL